jgi:uncharacterized OB-fold protein
MATVKPYPKADEISAPFWKATMEHRFLVQKVRHSRKAQFFPRPSASPTEWISTSGTATLIAITECCVPAPGFENEVPYYLGIVQMDEGPRVLASIVKSTSGPCEIGSRMQIAWGDALGNCRPYAFEPLRHADE